jgi:hypothetical protein
MRTALALALAAATSCAPPRNEVVIGLFTDLDQPGGGSGLGLNRVVITTRKQQQVIATDDRLVGWGGSGEPLPGTYAVYTDDGSTPTLNVEVLGYDGGGAQVASRRALFALPRGRTTFLPLGLAKACFEVHCQTGFSCADGHCIDEAVNAEALPDYRPELLHTLECRGASQFVDTTTDQPLPISGDGSCPVGAQCREGSCRLRPTLQFAAGVTSAAGLGPTSITAVNGFFPSAGLMVLDTAASQVLGLTLLGNGTFTNQVTYSADQIGNAPVALAFAEQTKSDPFSPVLAVSSSNPGKVHVLERVSPENRVPSLVLDPGAMAPAGRLVAGRFHGPNMIDIAMALPDGLAFFDNAGDGTFGAVQRFTTNGPPTAIATATTPGKDIDFVIAGSAGGEIVATPGPPFPPNFRPPSWQVGEPIHDLCGGDLAGDGNVKLVVATTEVEVLDTDPGVVAAPARYPVASAPCRVVVADFDRDGAQDVAVLGGCDGAAGGSTVSLLQSGPRGVLGPPGVIETPHATDIAVADFDGDGRTDFVLLLPDSKEVVFYRNQTSP